MSKKYSDDFIEGVRYAASVLSENANDASISGRKVMTSAFDEMAKDAASHHASECIDKAKRMMLISGALTQASGALHDRANGLEQANVDYARMEAYRFGTPARDRKEKVKEIRRRRWEETPIYKHIFARFGLIEDGTEVTPENLTEEEKIFLGDTQET